MKIVSHRIFHGWARHAIGILAKECPFDEMFLLLLDMQFAVQLTP